MTTQPSGPVWERLEDQIHWYGRASRRNQSWYKALKILTIVAAALVPLTAARAEWSSATALLGVLVIVIEGVQSLNQYQQLWIQYRSVAERLKREHSLFLAGARPYAGVVEPLAVLAERIEAIMGEEQSSWLELQERARGQEEDAARRAVAAGGE